MRKKIIAPVFFLFALFISCQWEDQEKEHSHEQHSGSNVFSKKSLDQLPVLKNNLEKDRSLLFSNKSNYETINYFDKLVTEQINVFEYDAENGLHYYTFALNIFEVNQKTNLVVKETLTGYRYFVYIFKPENYDLWARAVATNDIHYKENTQIDFFEIGSPESAKTFSTSCFETIEIWTCPEGVHTLGSGDWYNCYTFDSGEEGLNKWTRRVVTEMVSCEGMGGDGSGPPTDSIDDPTSSPTDTGGSDPVSSAVPNLSISDPCVLDASTSFLSTLTPAQLDWWENKNNIISSAKIALYLSENGCSDGDREFARQTIDRCIETGLQLDVQLSKKSPAFVDLLDINAGTPEGRRFHCIYNKLINSPTFKNLFTNTFGGTQDKINVKFKLEPNLKSANGNDVDGKCLPTVVTNGKYYTTILINSDVLFGTSQRSNLIIAKAIIHEYLHAFLNLKYLNINAGASLLTLSNEQLEELMYHYFTPDTEHDFMFNHLIPVFQTIFSEIISDLLSTEDINDLNNENITDANGNFIENFDFMNFYKYLTFEGLHNSQSFTTYIQSDSNEFNKYKRYKEHAENSAKTCQ